MTARRARSPQVALQASSAARNWDRTCHDWLRLAWPLPPPDDNGARSVTLSRRFAWAC